MKKFSEFIACTLLTPDNQSPTCCPVSAWDWPDPGNTMDAQSAINAVRAANSANDFEAQSGCALATCTCGAGIWFCAEPVSFLASLDSSDSALDR